MTSGEAPLTVSFTDLSTNEPDSWSWDFSGGDPASSSNQHPTVTYNTPGTYSVSLTVTNAAGSDSLTRTNYITVMELSPFLNVSPSSLSVGNSAGSTSFSITSNTGWSVSESDGWLSVSPASGSNNGTVDVTYTANTSTSPRTGIITVSGSGAASETVTVTQSGVSPFLNVSPSSLSVGNSSGSTSFSITSNTSWSVSESDGWLSVSPASGSNNGTVDVTYTANTSTSPRTGIITVSGSGAASETVTVTQSGVSPFLNVTPPSLSVGNSAGSMSFSITSNTSWSVSESDGWLSVSPVSGSNNGTLDVTYTANTSTSPRTGIITVSGSGTASETVTVTQSGVSPFLNVSPSSLSVSNSSGSMSFSITSNTSWSVSESDGWLSVSPVSGSNNGTVDVTYTANTSTSPRTGIITVSGSGAASETVMVTQSGDLALPNLTRLSGASSLNVVGTNVDLGITVINDGNAMASSSQVGYYLSADEFFSTSSDNYLIGTDFVTSLGVGSTSSESISVDVTDFDISPGTYYVFYFIDHLETVSESDETDNIWYWPDLPVTISAASYCSGTVVLTAFSGSFSDGSENNNYINDSDCKWLIQPDEVSSITLEFSSLSLEDSYDFIRVYDGSTFSAPLLGVFSGSSLPPPLTSSGGVMLVHFTSDYSITAEGWEATYFSEAVGIDEDELDGQINIFPNPTNNELNFDLSLEKPENVTLMIYNMYGQQLETHYFENVSEVNRTIELGHREVGIYFVKYKVKDTVYSKKIVLIK